MHYFLIYDSILFVLQNNSKAIGFLFFKYMFSNFLVSFPVSWHKFCASYFKLMKI